MRKVGKRLIIGVLACVMSLVGAASASAYDGWADSLPTAYQLQAPILGVSTYIDSSADVDWYSWTNTSSTSKGVVGKLVSPSGKNYDLVLVIFVGGVPVTVPMTDNGVGNSDQGSTAIDPGETIYFQVRGHDTSQYSASQTYNFSLTIS